MTSLERTAKYLEPRKRRNHSKRSYSNDGGRGGTRAETQGGANDRMGEAQATSTEKTKKEPGGE